MISMAAALAMFQQLAGNYNPITQAKFRQVSESQSAGGWLSGPILKDKLFFFAGWEAL